MLHKIIIENYKSFGTKSEISLYPNPKRTFYQNHIYSGEDLLFPVLKHCLVVGPNASGKTNMVTALKFLKEFCSGQFHNDPKEQWLRHWYFNNRFNMPIAEDMAPIHFLVEFSKGGRYYEYSINFDGEGIKIEALYLVRGNRLRPQPVFLRTRDKVEFHKEIPVSHDDIIRMHQQMKFDPETSFLVLNANFNFLENEDMRNAQAWFCENMEVSCEDFSVPYLMDFYCRVPRALQFTNTILKTIGIGCTLAITEHKPSDWLKANAKNVDREILNLFESGQISPAVHCYNGDGMVVRSVGKKKVIRELEFVHTGANGYERRNKGDGESSGTMHLLTVCAILYHCIFEGKSYVVDGIDLNINGATFRDLLKYYCETDGCGQLIYTTNSLMTMNQQEMARLDEVNLLEKRDGCTRVIALDKLPKIKTLLSLERNYLDGRFGGRPGQVSVETFEE